MKRSRSPSDSSSLSTSSITILLRCFGVVFSLSFALCSFPSTTGMFFFSLSSSLKMENKISETTHDKANRVTLVQPRLRSVSAFKVVFSLSLALRSFPHLPACPFSVYQAPKKWKVYVKQVRHLMIKLTE